MRQEELAACRNFTQLAKFPSPGDLDRAAGLLRRAMSATALTTGRMGSLALLPIAMAQGAATRRRMPILPPAKAPHEGYVTGTGTPIRLLAIGESSVSGVGISSHNETVAAVTARALGRLTGRPIVWRTLGLSGATVRDATEQLLPRVRPEPTDLLVIGFGVNDATAYRSPAAFTDDLVNLVTAVRKRVGDAGAVIAGVAPLSAFPGLPWPLRAILGWRSKLLQAAVERLPERLTRVVVERFSAPFTPDLFAEDGFHPSSKAHKLWGEDIAALALPFLNRR